LPLLGPEGIACANGQTESLGRDPASGVAINADAHHLRRPYNEAKRDLVDHFERQYLDRSLRDNAGNIAQAARASGKPRRVFFELMRKHGIKAADYMAKINAMSIVVTNYL